MHLQTPRNKNSVIKRSWGWALLKVYCWSRLSRRTMCEGRAVFMTVELQQRVESLVGIFLSGVETSSSQWAPRPWWTELTWMMRMVMMFKRKTPCPSVHIRTSAVAQAAILFFSILFPSYVKVQLKLCGMVFCISRFLEASSKLSYIWSLSLDPPVSFL